MSRLLLQIGYDGADFHGCTPASELRTVCGEIASSLERVGSPPILIETLSRTDAGVHAIANIAHLVPARPLPPAQALRLLDRHLPPDLRCHAAASVQELPPVGAKTYRYTLDLSRWGDPHLARTAWRPTHLPDRALLDQLAETLLEPHDFEAFRRRGETRESLVRHLSQSSWTHDKEISVYEVRGKGFPYRLVRSLVGGMIATATGACSPADWTAALHGRPSHASRQTAPAHGLCLAAIQADIPWISA